MRITAEKAGQAARCAPAVTDTAGAGDDAQSASAKA